MKAPLLEVRGLTVRYGAVQAVSGVSLEVREGELVTLIGANGAGKSSVLRALSGMVPYSGEVVFGGVALAGLSADRVAARGLVHVPEGRGIFGNLTVMENLRLASWLRADREQARADIRGVLDQFPSLARLQSNPAGMLSGGEQQMLAIGRALVMRGRMLLLDEPSMGLAPRLVGEIFAVLGRINREGVTVLLVEQNAHKALEIAHRGYVLENGRMVLEGDRDVLVQNPRVQEAYLGA